MKIVVIGGSGLIGSKTVNHLRQRGHEVAAASPSTGVNTVTGEGLAEAFAGTDVVIDVANSPSFESVAAHAFFEAAGRNIFAAEKTAGVKHHVALSVVGTERLLEFGYFGAKLLQERLIRESGQPYTLVRATQFFEFVGGIAQEATQGQTVRVSPARIQPIAAEDVAAFVADAALGEPRNGMFEIAGPDSFQLDRLVRKYLVATGDTKEVITDPDARYFGIRLDDRSLTPDSGARIGAITFDRWLADQATAAAA
ncbi:MAG TPA: SDR family oxidoreductase [Xanthobacteraceae bacterium]|jgi:uncharacterized protein YbjT (DUF2867 family)